MVANRLENQDYTFTALLTNKYCSFGQYVMDLHQVGYCFSLSFPFQECKYQTNHSMVPLLPRHVTVIFPKETENIRLEREAQHIFLWSIGIFTFFPLCESWPYGRIKSGSPWLAFWLQGRNSPLLSSIPSISVERISWLYVIVFSLSGEESLFPPGVFFQAEV